MFLVRVRHHRLSHLRGKSQNYIPKRRRLLVISKSGNSLFKVNIVKEHVDYCYHNDLLRRIRLSVFVIGLYLLRRRLYTPTDPVLA